VTGAGAAWPGIVIHEDDTTIPGARGQVYCARFKIPLEVRDSPVLNWAFLLEVIVGITVDLTMDEAHTIADVISKLTERAGVMNLSSA